MHRIFRFVSYEIWIIFLPYAVRTFPWDVEEDSIEIYFEVSGGRCHNQIYLLLSTPL